MRLPAPGTLIRPVATAPAVRLPGPSTTVVSPIPISRPAGEIPTTTPGIFSPPAPVSLTGGLGIKPRAQLPPPPVFGKAMTLSKGGAPGVVAQTGLIPIEPSVKPEESGGPMMTVVPISVSLSSEMITGGTMVVTAKGDDTYANIRTDRFGANMIRLASITGNSAIFHALAKCLLPDYARNRDYTSRVNLAHQLRAQIGYFWTAGPEYYTSAGEGKWAQNAKISKDPVTGQLTQSTTLIPLVETDEYGKRIDYSFQGLRRTFNSDRIISERFYGDIVNALGIKLIIVDVVGNLIRDDIRFKRQYPRAKYVQTALSSGRTVVLFQPDSGVMEIVGVKTPSGLLQLVFRDDDSLITAIKSKS